MTYHPPPAADHPAQPVVHGDCGRARSAFDEGSGGTAAGRRFFEMPGSDGNVGKLAAIDVDDHEGDVEPRSARAVPDRGAVAPPAGWCSSAISIAHFRALDVKTGEVLWSTRLSTAVQGFPVTFTANGRQYVAVTTGNGGGSPRVVPRTIAPEIKPPARGHRCTCSSCRKGSAEHRLCRRPVRHPRATEPGAVEARDARARRRSSETQSTSVRVPTTAGATPRSTSRPCTISTRCCTSFWIERASGSGSGFHVPRGSGFRVRGIGCAECECVFPPSC